MARSRDVRPFSGWRAPRYTQVPDQLFDEHLAHLSGPELKCLLYIMRRTFGFKKEADDISLSQICRGIVTRDGRRLDEGTGLSKQGAITALANLEAYGMIRSRRNSAWNGADAPKTYELVMDDSPRVKNVDTGGPRHGHGGSTAPAGGAGPVDTQETVIQETEEQETEDSSTRLEPSGEYLAEREVILEYVEDFARELGDKASLGASTSRAHNLFRKSELPLEQFLDEMRAARAITKERTAAIKAGENGRKRKMGYFFAVLEQRLKGQSSDQLN